MLEPHVSYEIIRLAVRRFRKCRVIKETLPHINKYSIKTKMRFLSDGRNPSNTFLIALKPTKLALVRLTRLELAQP